MNSDALEPAYLLHSRRYRNTSALLELFTVNHGRVGAVVKGIYSKGTSAQHLRSQLQLARPLLVSLSGRSDLKSLTHFEALPGAGVEGSASATAVPSAHSLYCVMYLNELLVRLLPAHFACPALFAAYQSTLSVLTEPVAIEPALRQFELQLLETLGHAIDFENEAGSDRRVDDDARYRFVPDHGFCRLPAASNAADEFQGVIVRAIGAHDFADVQVIRAAKRLLRLAINHQLGGRPLRSRELFQSARRD